MSKFESLNVNGVGYILLPETAEITDAELFCMALREDGEEVHALWDIDGVELDEYDRENPDEIIGALWKYDALTDDRFSDAETGNALSEDRSLQESLLIEDGYTTREARRQIANGAEVLTAAEVRALYERAPEVFATDEDEDGAPLILTLAEVLKNTFEVAGMEFYLLGRLD